MIFGRQLMPILTVMVFFSASLNAGAAEGLVCEGVAKPRQSVVMSASLSEAIVSINVEEGERIAKGQVLVNLESEKEVLSVERLEVMVTKAEFDFNAVKRLFDQKVTSRDEMLSKEVELKRMQVELEMAKAVVAERQMLAPFDGVVVNRYREPGEAVNEADPILKVIDADKLLLLFYMDVRMLSVLKVGDQLDVTFPEISPPLARKAVITFVDPEVDGRSGMFRVRLLMENADHAARPGMKVRTEIPSIP
jgi:RND family efflux transporter MFP subunit